MAIDMKRLEEIEDAMAGMISQLNLDEDDKTAFMIASAAGTIAASHLIYVDLTPDERGLDILTRAFQASFRLLMKKAAISKAWHSGEEDGVRH